ncbi:MAG: EamA family transporter [Deltaproteobacteria bacterium]|nr:EamA family transporter [Deltaproteobacteria bacterium]
MTGYALGIVLVSAFFHSCWNYLAKRSGKKIVFIWWFLLSSLVLYVPMLLYYWSRISIPRTGWVFVAATGGLHFLYFFFLGGAYERGDLSLVYPLARGSAPLFVSLSAPLLIGEELSALGGLGILTVVAGIYIIHLRSFSKASFAEPLRAIRGEVSLWALSTGGTISAYSIVDKVGVNLVHPPVYIYLMFLISWLMLSPFVLLGHRRQVAIEWQTNKVTILLVSILIMASYLMILFAFQIAKVSYVVAAREASILFSVLLGVLQLNEKQGLQKTVGAAFIAMGVVLIGLTR